MRWIDTQLPDEASTQSALFWAKHREAHQNDEFWAYEIKELKDDAEARLQMALANLPLPAAFREVAVALRAMIRFKRKEGSDFQHLLKQLYDIAAYESMMLEYAPRLQQPGYNVMASIPGQVVTGLTFVYDTLGYLELRLLNKTDVKWFVEAWGEPTRHTTLNAMYKPTWDRFEDVLIELEKKNSCRFIADLVALQQQSSPTHPPLAPKATEHKWWKFWQ
jgi:hypothetical protein